MPIFCQRQATACGGINTIWETKEIFSEVWEKSAAVDSFKPNSKAILLRLRQHFVDTRFLSMRECCQRENFVKAKILLTREFCQRENFVDARILWTPIISVGANILSPPIFFRHQYFGAANILSPPIFLSVFRLRMII
jgi:hypothetical protein